MINEALRTILIEDIDRAIKRALDAGMPESEVRWLINRAFRNDADENPPIFTVRGLVTQPNRQPHSSTGL